MPPSVASSKYFLRELSLIRLYIVLLISFIYFIAQMVCSHMAHSLILQVYAYQMLYNILGLVTSIITTKMCRNNRKPTDNLVKNTFGWTRIDVIGAVSGLCFLAALCFSIAVEALQAMFHSSHHEKMTMEFEVLVVGIAGLFVNSVACAIIGGYTQQQKSFLGSHKEGQDVVISPASRRGPYSTKLKCSGSIDILRDFSGCILVIAVSLVGRYWKHELVDFVDPCVAILEVAILGILSFQFAKEAGYILLLTIPDHINFKSLEDELFESFQEIEDIHEFHVYQLNPSRVIATAHVVLHNTDNCWVILNNMVEFLESKGVSHVTLQPEFIEFHGANEATASPETIRKRRQCFLPCKEAEDCHGKKCCLSDQETPQDTNHHHSHGHSHHGHKTEWNLFNVLRSKSSQNVDSLGSEKPSTSTVRFHANKSNPELTKDKDAIVFNSNKNIEQKQSNMTNEEEDESTDDEDKEVLKPMI